MTESMNRYINELKQQIVLFSSLSVNLNCNMNKEYNDCTVHKAQT